MAYLEERFTDPTYDPETGKWSNYTYYSDENGRVWGGYSRFEADDPTKLPSPDVVDAGGFTMGSGALWGARIGSPFGLAGQIFGGVIGGIFGLANDAINVIANGLAKMLEHPYEHLTPPDVNVIEGTEGEDALEGRSGDGELGHIPINRIPKSVDL